MEPWSHKTDRTPEELLHADRYTVDELSRLLGIGDYEIQRAVHEGDLKADVVNHQIVDIHREDVLDWLRRRDLR